MNFLVNNMPASDFVKMFKTMSKEWHMPDGLMVNNQNLNPKLQKSSSSVGKVNIEQAIKTMTER